MKKIIYILLLIAFVIKSNAQSCVSLNNQVSQLAQKGLYNEGLDKAKIALKKCKDQYGANHENYATSLTNYYVLLLTSQNYKEAIPIINELLKNIEKRIGKNNAEYGIHLRSLGLSHVYAGNYLEAIPVSKEALKIIKNTLGENSPYFTKCLGDISYAYQYLAKYDDAISYIIKANQIIEKTQGKLSIDYGISINTLSSIYTTLGLHEEALPLAKESLEIIEKTVGQDNYQFALAKANLGIIYSRIGENENAIKLLSESAPLIEKYLGKNHDQYNNLLNQLSVLYLAMARYDKALEVSQMLIETIDDKSSIDYGSKIGQLAHCYAMVGQNENALKYFKEAIKNIEKNYGKEHYNYAVVLESIALLHDRKKSYWEAFSLFQESIKIRKEQIIKQYSFLTEEEKLAYSNELVSVFETYNSFTKRNQSKLPETITLANNNALLLKGLILSNSQNLNLIADKINNTVVKDNFIKWKETRTNLAEQYSLPINDRDLSIDSLEKLANDFERKILQESIDFYNDLNWDRVKWENIRDNLQVNEAAIEFISFDYASSLEWTDSTYYVALITKSDSKNPEWVDLFEAKELDQVLNGANKTGNDANIIANLYTRGANSLRNSTSFDKGQSLYELIWTPLEPYLKEVDRIYYSPSGSLHKIAFAALKDSSGNVLGNKHELVQLSSTRELAITDAPIILNKESQIALYGGIQYDMNQTDLLASANAESKGINRSLNLPEDGSRGSVWNYLDGTKRETDTIAQYFDEQKIYNLYYSNTTATEASFKQLSGQSPQVIHIATHGFFFPDIETDKDDFEMMRTGESVARYHENPLMRSGLILAGANHVWQGGERLEGVEDGILTAYEISNMDLTNTELVVMSACETGLGEINGSEGVFGLQRAFKMAGVDYLMMSLWQVPDKETAEFMMRFYKLWLGGKEIRDAFNTTQKEMATKYADEPYKWAAFVLVE